MKSVKLQASVQILNSPSKGKSNEQPQQQGNNQRRNKMQKNKENLLMCWFIIPNT